MGDLPKRKNMRLKDYDYSQNGAYFITICVKDKQELLGKIDVGATVPGRSASSPQIELSEIGRIVDVAIKHNEKNDVTISKYVIMPNHIHMIVLIRSDTGDRGRSPLQLIVRNMKAFITKQIGFSFWQRSYYDHIIRNEDEYRRIWQYIDTNPAKWAEDKYFCG